MKNYRILAKDVIISNDTKLTGLNNNDMIIGSSGSGKTGGYVIPNLQNITGSMVVSDTKTVMRLLEWLRSSSRNRGFLNR